MTATSVVEQLQLGGHVVGAAHRHGLNAEIVSTFEGSELSMGHADLGLGQDAWK